MYGEVTMNEEMIIPVVVAGIIEEEQILLLKRNRNPFKGMWSLPGGKIAFDEFITHALEREVEEETGLRVTGLEFLGIVSELLIEKQRVEKGHLINVFLARTDQSRIRSSVEGELKWFNCQELENCKSNIIPTDFLITTEMLYTNKHGAYVCRIAKSGEVYTVEEFGEV